jgi:glycosyltransferase involved in cell wall biosynthesis
MRVLFIVPYPHGVAPSQRFRFEQYLNTMEDHEIKYTLAPFLDLETWRVLYKPGYTFIKVKGIFKGFLRRMKLLTQVPFYDFVFIHREATPIGPPVIEWIIAKVFRKRIIYDFDDAIWIPNTSESNKIASIFKRNQKVGKICKWSYKVSCGNSFLMGYAAQYADLVVFNPTTLDTVNLHNPVLYKKQDNIKPVIGWTGTHSTLFYLEPLLPVFKRLEEEYEFELCVIANKDPKLPLKSFKFVCWNKDTEIQDLLRFDMGLMPLTDDKWANGKCGFKALQYMSLGVPPLVSPVGVNIQIVEHGKNGYICNTDDEWYNAIRLLLHDITQRKALGEVAKKKVEQCYSVQANSATFLGLFTLA